MRHICLFPWYFKGGFLAEGNKMYTKKKKKKEKITALAIREKLSISNKFHRIVVIHLLSVKYHESFCMFKTGFPGKKKGNKIHYVTQSVTTKSKNTLS